MTTLPWNIDHVPATPHCPAKTYIVDAADGLIAIIPISANDTTGDARARLIATAPDLLVAATHALAVLEGVAIIRHEGDAIEKLAAAIALATGHGSES